MEFYLTVGTSSDLLQNMKSRLVKMFRIRNFAAVEIFLILVHIRYVCGKKFRLWTKAQAKIRIWTIFTSRFFIVCRRSLPVGQILIRFRSFFLKSYKKRFVCKNKLSLNFFHSPRCSNFSPFNMAEVCRCTNHRFIYSSRFFIWWFWK